jgi:hypothetical protein
MAFPPFKPRQPWPRGRTDPPEEEARTTLPSGIVNLLDFPFPGHRAPRENARKSGISILLCSLFLVGFRSVDNAAAPAQDGSASGQYFRRIVFMSQ